MSNTVLLAVLLIAQSQSAPSAGSALTRSLNAAPPAAVSPAPRPTPAPATVAPPSSAPNAAPAAAAAAPSAMPIAPARTPPSAVANPPRPQPMPTPAPAAAAPAAAVAPVRAPTPAPAATAPATTVRPAAATPVPAPAPAGVAPRAASPAPVTAPAPAAAAPAAPAPAPMTVLDAPAIRALPFTIDLPAGFTITTGRPGPNFNIWTIRRGQQSLVMVYAGPASQFPIYSGQMVETAGRASVVANEDGRRVALEHLFTRTTAPTEIHVWITSVEGADRALAERIGQSIDAR